MHGAKRPVAVCSPTGANGRDSVTGNKRDTTGAGGAGGLFTYTQHNVTAKSLCALAD